MKRAADLVEALYGMPHSNQVRTAAAVGGASDRTSPDGGGGGVVGPAGDHPEARCRPDRGALQRPALSQPAALPERLRPLGDDGSELLQQPARCQHLRGVAGRAG